MPSPCRCKPDSSLSTSATPALTELSAPLHADQISEANANFFGLDTTHDQDSKDDIVTAELAIPVNKEIHLLMHSKDVGHSFYVPELRIQQDFLPGLDLSVHFTATKIGKYEIVCTQLCGLGTLQHEGVSRSEVAGRLRCLDQAAGGIAVASAHLIWLNGFGPDKTPVLR